MDHERAHPSVAYPRHTGDPDRHLCLDRPVVTYVASEPPNPKGQRHLAMPVCGRRPIFICVSCCWECTQRNRGQL